MGSLLADVVARVLAVRTEEGKVSRGFGTHEGLDEAGEKGDVRNNPCVLA